MGKSTISTGPFSIAMFVYQRVSMDGFLNGIYYAGWWFQIWILLSISYMGCHPSHWRTHIFQRGRSTTNQYGISRISWEDIMGYLWGVLKWNHGIYGIYVTMTWMVWGFPHFRKPAFVLMCVLLWWYPLVNVYITMERSTIFNGKTHYKWTFAIAMLNYQRVSHLKIRFQLVYLIYVWWCVIIYIQIMIFHTNYIFDTKHTYYSKYCEIWVHKKCTYNNLML